MRSIAAAANTVVPALLTLERLGFDISVDCDEDRQFVRATRGDETYVAADPIEVLGLVKLIEIRGWDWKAADAEIEEASASLPTLPDDSDPLEGQRAHCCMMFLSFQQLHVVITLGPERMMHRLRRVFVK